MDSVLIVTQSGKAKTVLTELLFLHRFASVTALDSGSKARRLLLERDFDLCIIDAPLIDEFGDKLSRTISENHSCQVILLASFENVDEIAQNVSESGVYTLPKPLSKELLHNAVRLACASSRKMELLVQQNIDLKQKVEDVKRIGKAKLLLMERTFISEQEAHKKIERDAMNERKTRREIAEDIISLYENGEDN